jgi:hypothetical protein
MPEKTKEEKSLDVDTGNEIECPKGNGKEKKRKNLNKNGDKPPSDEQCKAIGEATEKIDKNNKDHSARQSKCINGLLKFTKGMLCEACNPNYSEIFSTDSATGVTTVTLKTSCCTKLKEACMPYYESVDQYNKDSKENCKTIETHVGLIDQQANDGANGSEVTDVKNQTECQD